MPHYYVDGEDADFMVKNLDIKVDSLTDSGARHIDVGVGDGVGVGVGVGIGIEEQLLVS